MRAYERDCLRGNYPLFQPGVGLTQAVNAAGPSDWSDYLTLENPDT